MNNFNNGKIFEGAKFTNKRPHNVPGEKFFEFFNKKTLKIGLAIIAGTVGVMGNYYAVRNQIEIMRLDVTNNFIKDMYALGLTAFLDLSIVMFHLMRVRALTLVTTISAIMISVYANVHTISSKNGNLTEDVLAFIIGMLMAVLPIAILTYLMHLVMDQYNDEYSKTYGVEK